ncbi:MAG: hypothetical protein OJF49_000131 [Ktedonobacterales bacterium]|jgi:AcrR family transcriptional regulator|nr:MAG: hypothetical protein OJF49_000131 [Ktedonobacterales bacterium]
MSRPVKADARRIELLAAAIRVLARHGLSETTTRKIAAEARVNQATLLYYFESKDELLFAVLHEMMRMTEEIALESRHPGASLRDTITSSINAFWQHVESAPELQIMQYELTLYALRNPDAAWLAKQQYEGYCNVVETLFREAYTEANQSSAASFDALARFVVGGLDGLILQFVSDRNSKRARHDLEQLIAAVLALAEGIATLPIISVASTSNDS